MDSGYVVNFRKDYLSQTRDSTARRALDSQ